MDFEKARQHIGHEIECAAYGTPTDLWNVSIECMTCGEVIIDADAPEVAAALDKAGV
jgi:hypothetical protein